MRVLFSIIGAILGVMAGAASVELLGAIIGGLGVWLIMTQVHIQREIRNGRREPLQRTVAPPPEAVPSVQSTPLEDEAGAAEQPSPEPAPAPTTKPVQAPTADEDDPWRRPAAIPTPSRPNSAQDSPAVRAQTAAIDTGAADAPGATSSRASQSQPSEPEGWLSRIGTWLTTGNVPVKVGIIISFFGVAFFLKYAVDTGLFSFPIELRLASVAAFGLILLTIGWRLRHREAVYGLSLQGGGVGVLYLTVFAALRFYSLLPVTAAFGLMVLITALAGVLAVIQNARALAVLGAVGGFLAPILVSTGSGNHVILFSYYLVLNAAILAIAWFRAWRELNLVGFAFTFVIGGYWGWQNYQANLFGSTEPFLIAYFAFYHLVGILYAFKQPPKLKGLIDGTLIFGTPVVAFALQSRIVENFEYGLAWSAIGLALIYTVTALVLRSAAKPDCRPLVLAYQAMALAFFTLAIPLALDPRWTTAAWALQGAAMVWAGGLQSRTLIRLSGSALLIAAGVSFALEGWHSDAGMIVLNGNFLSGLLIGLTSVFSAWLLQRASGRHQNLLRGTGILTFFWGILWLLGSGILEISDRFPDSLQPSLLTGYFTLLALALLVAARTLNWAIARLTVLGFLYALALPALIAAVENEHLFAHWGWLAWPVAFLCQYLILWALRRSDRGNPRPGMGVHHHFTLLALTLAAMWEIGWQTQLITENLLWIWLAICAVPMVVYWLAHGMQRAGAWPFNDHGRALAAAAGELSWLQMLIVLLLNVEISGSPTPLPYIPILNPLDLFSALTLGQLVHWHWSMHRRYQWPQASALRLCFGVIALAGLLISTMAVVRAVHHIAHIPWDMDLLFDSMIVQSALSIFWGVLGLTGMVWGARRNLRGLWLIGASLMAIVVVKLFLVDLGNTGTIERVVSFIGTGLLLLVVGYLAPAPPRRSRTEEAELNTRL